VRQMQTADLQTRASVSQTSTLVSQTSTPVSQNSTSVRLFRLAISDGIGNTIHNLPVCSLQMSHTGETKRRLRSWSKTEQKEERRVSQHGGESTFDRDIRDLIPSNTQAHRAQGKHLHCTALQANFHAM